MAQNRDPKCTKLELTNLQIDLKLYQRLAEPIHIPRHDVKPYAPRRVHHTSGGLLTHPPRNNDWATT